MIRWVAQPLWRQWQWGNPSLQRGQVRWNHIYEEGINGVLVPGGDSKALRTAIKNFCGIKTKESNWENAHGHTP